MTFLFRCILILLVFAFVVYVFKAIARLSFNLRGTVKDLRKLREQINGRSQTGAEMVRCAACGAFVYAREAVMISQGKSRQSFCSRECMQAHARVKSA